MPYSLSQSVAHLSFIRLSICLLTLLTLPGCGVIYSYVNNEDKLDERLSVPMSKEQVLEKLGKPDKVLVDDGRQITWEYPLYSRYHWVKELIACPISVIAGGCIFYPYVGSFVGNTDPHYVVMIDEQLCTWGPRSVVTTRKTCKTPILAKQVTDTIKSKEATTSVTFPVTVLPVYMPPPIQAKVHRLAILPLSDAAGYALPAILDLVLNILRNHHQDIVLVERDLRPVLTEVLLQYSGRVSDESTVRVGRLAGADTLLIYNIEPFSQSIAGPIVNSGGVVPGTVEVKLMNVEEGTLLFRQQAMGSVFLPAPGAGRSWPSETLQTVHRNAVNVAAGYALVALLAAFGDNPLGIVPNPTLNGAEIYGVLEGSAAQRAGLKKGDRVLAVNGQDITTWTRLMPLSLPASLTIEREGKQREVAVMNP